MQADKCIDRTVQERWKKIRSDHITCYLWTMGRSDLIDSDRLLATRIKFKNGVTE